MLCSGNVKRKIEKAIFFDGGKLQIFSRKVKKHLTLNLEMLILAVDRDGV